MDTEIYKHALEQVSIITVTDTNGTITYANANFCRLAQYSAGELIGQNHRIINSGYHSAAFFENLWHTISQGQTWRGDIRNKAKDGTYFWFDTVIFPIKDSNGIITGYFSNHIDITEKKENEESKRQSERLLWAVMQSTQDTFFLIRPDHTVANFNRSAAQAVQTLYNRELRVGDDIKQYIIGGDVSTFLPYFNQALAGQVAYSEKHTLVNGIDFWYHFTYSPVYDQDCSFMGVSIIGTNNTAIKHHEAELEKSNERYRLISKASNDAIYDYNIIGNTIEWYDTFYELFEYDPNEVLVTLEWWAEHVHPDDRDRAIRSLEIAMVNRDSIWHQEYRFRCRSGHYKYVYERGYIQYAPDGTPTRMIGSLQDIQQLKEHEQKILAQNRSLRNIAFAQSHVIRKPVANILGLVSFINKAELSPENLQLINYLEAETQALDAVIRSNVTQINETYHLTETSDPVEPESLPEA